MTMELEGNQVNVGDLLDMMPDFNVKFYVCHAFMPLHNVLKEDLIEGSQDERKFLPRRAAPGRLHPFSDGHVEKCKKKIRSKN